MKIISLITICILLLLLFSCHNKKREYVEITLGFSMNPKEPRIGILIDDADSLYICREIMGNKDFRYEYFKSTQKIDFTYYKQNILNSFDTLIPFKSMPDAQSRQINYYLNDKNLKVRFYSHELSSKQAKVIEDLIFLKQSKTLVKIPYHNFSRELLYESMPQPPR